MTPPPIFEHKDARLGAFALRALDPAADAELLHGWVTHPKASYWMMLEADVAEVAAEYRRIHEHPHHEAFIGLHEGRPAFLAERYDPSRVELAGLYPARPGDVGMHFLCAPTGTPVHGFTLAVINAVMEFCFSDPHVRRVVVEPDVRNDAVHALNAAVGFEIVEQIAKPEKDAYLSICTRERFEAARTALAADAARTARTDRADRDARTDDDRNDDDRNDDDRNKRTARDAQGVTR
ncbi:GNAT family N-acetyltransferase [Streptomyces sp. OE57]|uniref:GNAT family N-acetyltransferase n=1 Tax=Streptomyces lacaronensis TaxID=3379885 RepID=UPI0039B77B11